ncbi:unnamed protein product [marine sediment metagenome]|uniref:Uncharacterized protein n=1 Tax=marine sediment metagenome TaxID=412755 RepID=X0UWP7_9ZZZZ
MGFFKRKRDKSKGKDIKSAKSLTTEKISSVERLSQGWLRCVFIIEIMGRPAEHISGAMKLVLKGLEKEKGVEIISKKVHKPKKVILKDEKNKKKDSKRAELFSTFSEIEFMAESLSRLIGLVFDFMPSSVEILDPQTLKININNSNSLINDLATRLHKNDAAVKGLYLQNQRLKREIEELKKK